MKELDELKKAMLQQSIEPQAGMPEELFLFSTTLSPVVNVDLLITNEKHQVLMTWREDVHNGAGWHIPGGCIRFRETMQERIQNCAMAELNMEVQAEPTPIAVVEHIIDYTRPIEDQNERAHFITICFKCHLPNGSEIPKNAKWFDDLPDNLLRTQEAYRKQWQDIRKKL